ncbi:MAG: RNA pseudouridine synthase [Puniceicoccales bacterium]|jgi:23S rRNA-/tRNA-specific pseudouridylate synthase|nr:RNA pseudouridine synthase [Puniceicoccales bacterium]
MAILISLHGVVDGIFFEVLDPKAYAVCADGNGVTALYKPCGVQSVPNIDGRVDRKSIVRAPYDSKRRCYILPDGQTFFLLNRLDTPTSGLLVGCFDETIAEAIRWCFFNREVHKIYCALTRYQKIQEAGEFYDILTKQREQGHLRVAPGRCDEAVARYGVERELEMGGIPLLRLRLEPVTGRTHQLRVQCALRKIPIIGDKIYGDFTLNRKLWAVLPEKRLYLQSCAIKFSYKFHAKTYLFSAKIPCEF